MKLKALQLSDIAYRAPRDLQLGVATYGWAPAEKRDHVSAFIQSVCDEGGQFDLPRGPPPVPLTEARYDLRE
jgi:hypothetical protein